MWKPYAAVRVNGIKVKSGYASICEGFGHVVRTTKDQMPMRMLSEKLFHTIQRGRTKIRCTDARLGRRCTEKVGSNPLR